MVSEVEVHRTLPEFTSASSILACESQWVCHLEVYLLILVYGNVLE